jgi:urease accessory protein UreH
LIQDVADADYKFITVEVSAAGRQSDGEIFATSTLYKIWKIISSESWIYNTKL